MSLPSLSLMADETAEAPRAVARALRENAGQLKAVAKLLETIKPSHILTCARGSSDHAASYFKYLSEIVMGVPCCSLGASVASVYEAKLKLRDTVLLTISQSGRSPDILAMQSFAKASGTPTIAIGSVANFLDTGCLSLISDNNRGFWMFKGCHFDRSLILLCVRWYLAYGLSLRDLEEMMAERGISIDHSTIHRWVIRFSPKLLRNFNLRKRSVTAKWHMDETYIKVHGEWMYLSRAIDSVGDTVEFYFSKNRDLPAAKRFFRQALDRHGRPDRVVIDGSQTNREALVSCDTTRRLRDETAKSIKSIEIRKSKHLNNRIEQDHLRIKRRTRPMLGFKTPACADIILAGIEIVHMMRKRQARFSYNPNPSLAEQFAILAA